MTFEDILKELGLTLDEYLENHVNPNELTLIQKRLVRCLTMRQVYDLCLEVRGGQLFIPKKKTCGGKPTKLVEKFGEEAYERLREEFDYEITTIKYISIPTTKQIEDQARNICIVKHRKEGSIKELCKIFNLTPRSIHTILRDENTNNVVS